MSPFASILQLAIRGCVSRASVHLRQDVDPSLLRSRSKATFNGKSVKLSRVGLDWETALEPWMLQAWVRISVIRIGEMSNLEVDAADV